MTRRVFVRTQPTTDKTLYLHMEPFLQNQTCTKFVSKIFGKIFFPSLDYLSLASI